MVRRLPLAAAIAFALLSVCAVVVVPLAPGVDRSGTEIVEHFSTHAGVIRLQVLLAALALLALAVILGHARDRLDGPPAHIFTIGSAVLIGQTGIALWFDAGLALHAETLDPATARTLSDIAAMWGPVLTVAAILTVGPVVWAARQGRFPRWLAVIAAVFAVEQFVEMLTIVGPDASFIAPGGPMNVFLGGALSVVFFAALGLAVALPVDPAAESAGQTGGEAAGQTTADTADTAAETGPDPAVGMPDEAAPGITPTI
jgi:hypothetical protein